MSSRNELETLGELCQELADTTITAARVPTDDPGDVDQFLKGLLGVGEQQADNEGQHPLSQPQYQQQQQQQQQQPPVAPASAPAYGGGGCANGAPNFGAVRDLELVNVEVKVEV